MMQKKKKKKKMNIVDAKAPRTLFLSHKRLDYASLFVPLKKWPLSAVEISIL